MERRLRILDHVHGRGVNLFRVACERDLDGEVGKWANGSYLSDPRSTCWTTIKNRSYSQMEGRHELFEWRRVEGSQRLEAFGTKDVRISSQMSSLYGAASGDDGRRGLQPEQPK